MRNSSHPRGADPLPFTAELMAGLLDDYRMLHASPELSLAEHRTTEWLAEQWTRLGFELYQPSDTGFAAVLVNGDGPVVAFRADIDALPVTEETGVEWASQNGAMHACGHDIHMVAALGAARLLAAHREAWSGTLEFILQPAEEIVQGARAMLDGGLWERIPHPEVIFGQHVWPITAGEIQLLPGPFFATVDTYRIQVLGRGGHGSMPETTVDAVVLTAAIVMRLQTVVSREIGLHEKAVLTVGAMHAGSKENIIAGSGELLISTRSYSEDVRRRLADAIERVARAEAMASGAPAPVITPMYRAGSIINDADATARLRDVFVRTFGVEAAHEPEHPMTASEDFGLLGEAIGVPGVFWVFGGYTPERMAAGSVPTNHSPQFLPDPESSIRTGVRAALAALLSRLGG